MPLESETVHIKKSSSIPSAMMHDTRRTRSNSVPGEEVCKRFFKSYYFIIIFCHVFRRLMGYSSNTKDILKATGH